MSAQAILLGIDIGTTNLKIIAATPEGETLAVERRTMVIANPAPGAAEFDLAALNRQLFDGIAVLLARLGEEQHHRLAAISVASIGESVVGVDAQGEAITPCPTWYDRRTSARRQAVPLPVSTWYDITGMVDDDIYTACRLFWWRQQSPALFNRVRHWLMVADYVTSLLCGKAVGNPSLAARSGLADRRDGIWSTQILQALAISAETLPLLLPAANIAGKVTPAAARLTGLPAGLPVVNAGHDHPCAGFGCGLVTPGHFIDSTGTSEALKTVVSRPLSWGEVGEGQYDCYPHVIPGCWLLSGHIPSSGSMVDWLTRLLAGPRGRDEDITLLWRQAAAAPPGAQGVTVAPFLEGSGAPWNQRSARASVTGLGTTVAAGDLLRAAVEALAAWLWLNLQRFSHITGFSPPTLTLTGGGARNELSNHIKAAMVEKTCLIPEVEEAAGLGAALVGGLAIGVFTDAAQAATRTAIAQRVLESDTALSAQYVGLRQSLAEALQLRSQP